MKIHFTFTALLLGALTANSQTPIMAVDTSSTLAPAFSTYTSGPNTYNWGVSPNDTIVSLFGLIAGSKGYTYMDTLHGNVKLRRVNNPVDSGNISLEWVQTKTNGAIFNLYSIYQKSMDTFLTSNTLNKGTDNLFDNTSANSNDIERMDWMLANGYSTPIPGEVGVSIFDKGAAGTHDPFCIAVITSVDSVGNPLTYGNIVRVVAANYGDPGQSISYRIVKGVYPGDLINAGQSTQSIGGVFITLQNLGVTAGMHIYGYSLFSNDLPVSATPANLVDYKNATYFPLNTGNEGGLDLVAVTGFSIATSEVLPVTFLNFNAVDNSNMVLLKWSVENESSVSKYDIERSEDGVHFVAINQIRGSGNPSVNSYSLTDNVSSVTSAQVYYRVKQYDADGTYHYSKTMLIRLNNKTGSILIYPNPVRDNLYLNIASTTNDKVVISIFNSAGSRVLLVHESLNNGNNSFTIDKMGNLSKDIYQLSIKSLTSGKIVTKQFLKQ